MLCSCGNAGLEANSGRNRLALPRGILRQIIPKGPERSGATGDELFSVPYHSGTVPGWEWGAENWGAPRVRFADKCSYSQSYGFSNSRIHMRAGP